jgi:colanic acid/amylovoran biosynthesis glycosyltransferase
MAEAYRVYASAKAVLTRSELHRRRLIELGLPADKVHVNHGGVEVPKVPRERGPASGKRLLAVGVMAPKKAPIFLLESFRRAAKRDPELTLDYVGGGPLFPAAAQFVDACGLADRVRLHGVAPEAEKQRLLGECGVFVQHSMTDPATGDEEGLPAAIQEAMAAGMAVVSTRHAGIPEAVIEGKTGLLVDEGDVDAMADAFVRVGGAAIEMGRAGHAEARAKHAWAGERDRLRHWLFGAAG